MPYTAEINRANPTAILFLIDQSGSMAEALPSAKSKAQFLADVLNRTLANLIIRCTKGSGVWDYFDIGMLTYMAYEEKDARVENGFQGPLSSAVLNPISAIEASPLRIEERLKKFEDGAGGIVEEKVKFPVWFEPKANGGTPMCMAMYRAAEVLAEWCDAHPQSFPPIILHVTDGEPTDGDPEPIAERLKQIGTNDGPVLLSNLHICSQQAEPILFPSSELELPNDNAKRLFRMSSILPDKMLLEAQHEGYSLSSESRIFVYNADANEIVKFIAFGTIPILR